MFLVQLISLVISISLSPLCRLGNPPSLQAHFHYLFMTHCRVKPPPSGQDSAPTAALRGALPESEWPPERTVFKYPSHSAIMKYLLISTQSSCRNNRRHDPVGECVSVKCGGWGWGRGGGQAGAAWVLEECFLLAAL